MTPFKKFQNLFTDFIQDPYILKALVFYTYRRIPDGFMWRLWGKSEIYKTSETEGN